VLVYHFIVILLGSFQKQKNDKSGNFVEARQKM